MEIILIILVVIAILVNIGLVIAFVRRKPEVKEEDGEGLNLILTQMNELARTVDRKVGDLTKTVDTKIDASSRTMQASIQNQLTIVRDVTERLTKLDETNRQVISFADQLQHLQDILQNPKQRGILGEYYLESVLQNVLPPGQYQMQYSFKNGDIVDAVVFVKDNKKIPVDSKFSLENYNRAVESRNQEDREHYEKVFKADLKARIDETSKYVRPEEDTLEFAFMFIPSEGVYYDLLMNQVGSLKTQTKDLIDYAFQKKVIIVSPTSFLAYLQTVLQGLRALQIEEQAHEIKKRVGELSKHMLAYVEYHRKLGVTLGTVVNHYNTSNNELKKVDKDVLRITDESPGIKVMELEGPEIGQE